MTDVLSGPSDRSCLAEAFYRKNAILAARFCLGTPFRHQGRIPGQKPGAGLDCVGLILYVGRRIGCALDDHRDYRRFPRPGELEQAAQRAGLIERAVTAALPGDVVLLALDNSLDNSLRHAGLLSEQGLIHACGRRGRVVEHRLDQDWRDRLRRVYAFPQYYTFPQYIPHYKE
ncbi:NlpC/P60 family protein [Luteithermobacter gelatinilyticus]|uniref:NlpC/P60 family protein n=1 Tax=Luteithermobacter gelatinilyticus TaxID=2582913 RepID=UPI0011066E14|nr:NlpC/P60 family protein [Luteithermobacter gelatinilyticus]